MLVSPLQSNISTRQSHPSDRAIQPRFGMGADAIAKVLQPITEQFIYNFTFQDFAGLITPRSIGALFRSPAKYDIRQDPDPAVKNMTPMQQLIYSTRRNMAGLNYSNCKEESTREIGTGLSLIVSQAILLGIVSACLLGKSGLMMRYRDLEAFQKAFAQSIGSQPISNAHKALHPTLLKNNLLKQFIQDLLFKGHFKAGLAASLPDQLFAKDEALGAFLKKAFPSQQKITYQEAINTWINRWVELKPSKILDQKYLKESKKLEALFERLVFWFNDHIKKVTNPLDTNRLILPGLGKDRASSTAPALLENLHKFRGFVKETFKIAEKSMASLPAKGWGKNMQQALIQSSEKILRRITVMKPLLSIAATLLAGFSAIWVAALAQRGQSYPANKNLQLHHGGATKTPGNKPADHAGTHRAVPMFRNTWQQGGLQ